MVLFNSKKTANLLLFIFIILTLLLSVGGNVLYRYQKNNITIEKHNELAAISKLKVDQIVNWRNERLKNARSIYNNQVIIAHISDNIHGVDRDVNYWIITKWMNSIMDEPDYSSVLLIDPSGKTIINTNPAIPLSETDKLIIEQAKLSKDIVFSDLLQYSNKNIFIYFAIPLYLKPEKHEGFSGVVFLRIDPEKFLYPQILRWPTPSRSSEVLLSRREGDSVLFLSELQRTKNTALRLRKPMTDTLLLSVQAINGKTGVIEGVDYRGIKVLGEAQHVPNSQWFVITKVDIAEIYQPIFTLSIWIFIITFLLILISALIIYVIWSQQLNKSEKDRLLAVEKLLASEEGFRTLAESIPQFVWIVQNDGLILYINQQWAEYTGLPMEESYGEDRVTPYHPADRQLIRDAWKHAIETGESFDVECRIRQYDGMYHWFVNRGLPLLDSSGKIIKWYGTCTNIDSQKQTEKKIKKLNEELEHKVNERTGQLQNTIKELEAFSYSVSHDLRAPLLNIEGWSIMLIKHCYEQLNAKGRQCLDNVTSEVERMKNLIEALLKLSRVSQSELKKVHVDLSILAQDITKRLLKEPTDRQIEIIIQPGMFTFGDPDLLEIVLTNLLNNAYKYTGKQPLAQIEFGHSVIDEKQTFWVRDNGAGFDMANAKNLFGAFQRMHRQSDFPGIGIGLATVQRIIHRHDGSIWAESEINHGATFYFTIPEETI